MGIIFVDNMCSLGTIQIVLNLVVAATHAGFFILTLFLILFVFFGEGLCVGGE
jgi:hypothetical protein